MVPERVTARSLFRAMQRAPDGSPACGSGSRLLGVRLPVPKPPPGWRVDVFPDADGKVHPKAGGLSVSPDSPRNLPHFLVPVRYGGIGRLPVFLIREGDLPGSLCFVADPANPEKHGFIEPAHEMSAQEFQGHLWQTASLWTEVS